MSEYHEQTYGIRTTSVASKMREPFWSETWFEFGHNCIDAPDFLPAGSSVAIEPGDESTLSRFASQSTTVRGI